MISNEEAQRKLIVVTGMLRDLSTAILQERKKDVLQKMAYDAQKYLVLGNKKSGG